MAPKRSAPPPPPPAASDEESGSASGSDDWLHRLPPSPPSAAPKRVAPPPHKDQESEASDEDEGGEEEEANNVTTPSATKNPPPPTEDKKPFQRTWSTADEVRILEALAAHRLEHGTLPQTDALAGALAGKLDNGGRRPSDLKNKVKSLRRRYITLAKKGVLPSKEHDRRLLDLSKNVWFSATKASAGRGVDEMCKLYPYLAEEVKALQKEYPGLFKREFAMIDDSEARALDEKIKKQKIEQMKLLARRHDIGKEVTKTLMDLAADH